MSLSLRTIYAIHLCTCAGWSTCDAGAPQAQVRVALPLAGTRRAANLHRPLSLMPPSLGPCAIS